MIAVDDTVLILLAAGRSTRFGGTRSKLDEPLRGRPVGLHAAVALAALRFRHRIAVTGRTRIDYAAHGFDTVVNDDPDRGMALSLRLGVERARAVEAAAVLIALADMPCVTAAHVRRLLAAGDGDDAIVASTDGRAPGPPALFGRGRFAALMALDGDAGARDLLRAGRQVASTAAELADIDTPAALAALQEGGIGDRRGAASARTEGGAYSSSRIT